MPDVFFSVELYYNMLQLLLVITHFVTLDGTAEGNILGLPLAVSLERGGLKNSGHHLVTRGVGEGRGP